MAAKVESTTGVGEVMGLGEGKEGRSEKPEWE